MAKDCPLNRRNDNSTQAENSQDQPGSSQKRAEPNKYEMPQNQKENPKAKDPKQPVNTQKDKTSEKVSDDKTQEAIKIQEAIDKISGSVSTIRNIEDDASSVDSLCVNTDYEETLEKEPTKDWAAASGEKIRFKMFKTRLQPRTKLIVQKVVSLTVLAAVLILTRKLRVQLLFLDKQARGKSRKVRTVSHVSRGRGKTLRGLSVT